MFTQGDSQAPKFSVEIKFIAVIPGKSSAAAAAAKGNRGRKWAGEAAAGQRGTGALLGWFYLSAVWQHLLLSAILFFSIKIKCLS